VHNTLFYLALYPEHQRLAQTEVDALMDGIEESEEMSVTLAHLSQAKYLEMCWKEGMRLKPPVSIIGRRLTRDVNLGRYGRNILILMSFPCDGEQKYMPG
jgi:cytochrome P450